MHRLSTAPFFILCLILTTAIQARGDDKPQWLLMDVIQSGHVGGQLAARNGVLATTAPYAEHLIADAIGVPERVTILDYDARRMRILATVGENEMLLRYGTVVSIWGTRLAAASHRYTADGESLGSGVVLYRFTGDEWELLTLLSWDDIVDNIETDSDTTSSSAVGEAIALGEGVILVEGVATHGTVVYQIEENTGDWYTRSAYTFEYRAPSKLAIDGSHGVVLRGSGIGFLDIYLIDLSTGTIAQNVTVESEIDAIAFRDRRVALARAGEQQLSVQLFELNADNKLEATDRIEYESPFDIYSASVSLSGERLAVSARSASSDAKSGPIVVYELDDDQWRLEGELGYGFSNSPPYDSYEGFVYEVALDGNDLLIGKWYPSNGAVYRYHLARPAGADCGQHFDCIHRLCKEGQCADVDSGPWGSDWDAGDYEPAVAPVDEKSGCSIHSKNPRQRPSALLLLGIVLSIGIVWRRAKV